MKTLDPRGIASWDEPCADFSPLGVRASIATEPQPEAHAAWNQCIDALLALWSDASRFDAPPNRWAIESALNWLQLLRSRYPDAPPTYVIAEPAGGIILERSDVAADGSERISELTFYNNGTAESTLYRNGRIVQMCAIEPQPR